jgi:tRNA nucleotidyltransferase (CCA-adding enzyme)
MQHAALRYRNLARRGTATMTPGTHARLELFAHEADIGVRGIGPSRAAAFEQAARALVAVITDPDRVRESLTVEIACEAPDDELLLLEWLNAVLFEIATRDVVFRRFEVELDGGRLTARAHGEPLDRLRHQPAVEVKAATACELRVEQDADGLWRAQCVLDV